MSRTWQMDSWKYYP
ncbi:uncharacterized protein FFC1_01276 [Fusarium fujikuroi]|nr:uncharacterized protein FFC1_01276 [Fusarium fujikuroi]